MFLTIFFLIAVSKDFDLSLYDVAEGETWIGLLESVLEARTTMDPDTVSEGIWNAFLVYSLVLVPSIQGW